MQLRMRSMLPILVATLLVCASVPAVQAQGGPEATKGTSWAGKLVDSDCRAASPTAPCEASANTANFGLVTSNEAYYKLDSKGSQMAKDKVKATKKQGGIQVTVTGKLDGETIVVETLQISG